LPFRAATVARLRSPVVSERSYTFDDVTALLFSCFVPTLLRGRLTAAYEVPPSATISAR
jgi:hypothetical protein